MPLSLTPVVQTLLNVTNGGNRSLAQAVNQNKGNLTLTALNIGKQLLFEKTNTLGAGIGSPLNGITGPVNQGSIINLSNPVQNFVQSGVTNIGDTVGTFGSATSGVIENIASGGVQQIFGNVGQSVDALKAAQNVTRDLIAAVRAKNIPSSEVLSLGTAESVVEVYSSAGTSGFGGGGGGGGGGGDWRVQVESPLGVIIFPATPTLTLSNKANYNPQAIVHSNFPHMVYQHSTSDPIEISCEWPVETEMDASVWLEAITIGRAMTKMDFAGSGAPPVIATLSGLGDVLKNIPVVATSFKVDLKDDVHYIAAAGGNVPRLSTVSISLMPIYSRASQRGFSLGAYASGGGNIPF